MIQPQITVSNCNLSVLEIDERDEAEDSFEADDPEDLEETHKIKTKNQMILNVKTEQLAGLAKSNMKNWEKDVLDLIHFDVAKAYSFTE